MSLLGNLQPPPEPKMRNGPQVRLHNHSVSRSVIVKRAAPTNKQANTVLSSGAKSAVPICWGSSIFSVFFHGALHPQKPLLRSGEWRWRKIIYIIYIRSGKWRWRKIIYICMYLNCAEQSHKTVSKTHNLFKKKGELKRN